MFSLQTITSTADQIKTQVQETSSRYVDTEALKTKAVQTRDTVRTYLIQYTVLVAVFLYCRVFLTLWAKLAAMPQAAKVEEVYTAKVQPLVAKAQEKVQSFLTTYDVKAKAANVDEQYLMSTVADIVSGVQNGVESKTQEVEEKKQE